MRPRRSAYSALSLPIRRMPSLSSPATRHSSLATIPILFIHFRTLLHNERPLSAFPSIVSALFTKNTGGGGYPWATFGLPYILPSSVSSDPFVSHSYANCRGVPSFFPNRNATVSSTLVPRIGHGPVRGPFVSSSTVNCRLSTSCLGEHRESKNLSCTLTRHSPLVTRHCISVCQALWAMQEYLP